MAHGIGYNTGILPELQVGEASHQEAAAHHGPVLRRQHRVVPPRNHLLFFECPHEVPWTCAASASQSSLYAAP